MMPLPPSRRRPRAGLAAVAAAAAVVAVAVAVLVLLFRPASGQAPGQPPPRSSTAGRVPARAPGSPAAGPAAVSTAGWYAVALDGTAVPASRLAGPGKGPWPLAAGFADSPAGAVLAAVNIAVRTSGQLGPDVFTATISRQVTGAGAAALLSAAWKDYASAVGTHPPGSPGGPAGAADASARAFRLTSWTPDAATVDVLAGAGDGAGPGAVVRLQVRWIAGDWRLVAPASGVFTATAATAGLAGYTVLPGS
jgi:hypothetical protein